jgi:hypothetical protein
VGKINGTLPTDAELKAAEIPGVVIVEAVVRLVGRRNVPQQVRDELNVVFLENNSTGEHVGSSKGWILHVDRSLPRTAACTSLAYAERTRFARSVAPVVQPVSALTGNPFSGTSI